MSDTTGRLGLPYPEAADEADIEEAVKPLALALDSSAAVIGQGAASDRPAAGVYGRLYYATDTRVVSWDTGAQWREVRELGTGPNQAAAGTHGSQHGPAGADPLPAVAHYETHDTASLSIGSGISYSLPWSPETVRQGGFAVTEGPSLVAPYSGVYAVGCNATWAPSTAGSIRAVILKINFEQRAADQRPQPPAVITGYTCSIARTIHLNDGDYIGFDAYQNTGGNLAVAWDAWATRVGG